MRGKRWASNVVALVLSLVLVLACAGALMWLAPRTLDVSVTRTDREEAVFDAVSIEPTGAEKVMAAVAALNRKAEDVNALKALERSLCAGVPTDAVISQSLVLGDGGATQAVVLAMPPGTGTWAASEVVSSIPQCLGTPVGDRAPWMPVWGATSDAFESDTWVWSRGDFVVIVTGDEGQAQRVDDTLTSALAEEACSDIFPTVEDRYQNLLVSGSDYRPPTVKRVASIEPDAPEDGDGNVLVVPGAGDVPSAGPEVTVPEVPEGRTYWPELPEPVSRPYIEMPQSVPATSTEVAIPAKDDVGPGCGWAFFSYAAVETTAATEQEERDLIETAEKALEGSWDAWAESLQEFWERLDGYKARVDAYNAYRDEVDDIADVWASEVAPLWDAYDEAVAARDEAIEARQKWEERRSAALAQWNEFLAVCVPVTESDAVAPGTVPGPAPSPTPSPSANPVDGVSCDSRAEPEILTSEGPQVPDMPETPAPAPQESEQSPTPESTTQNSGSL